MTTRMYALPVEQTRWHVPSGSTTAFSWDYDDGRDRLLSLYEKGKQRQWDAAVRIDWSREIDPDNPLQLPDESVAIYGSRTWDRLGERDRATVRHHAASWQFSQFLHGEQGALICASKIVPATSRPTPATCTTSCSWPIPSTRTCRRCSTTSSPTAAGT